jgi:hypothetical protein
MFREIAADLHPSLEFDAKDLELLGRAAVVADLVEVLRRDLAARGPVVEGSTGRLMQNPAIDKIPRMQIQIARLLEKVRLEPEPLKTGSLGVKARNRIAREERFARGHRVA